MLSSSFQRVEQVPWMAFPRSFEQYGMKGALPSLTCSTKSWSKGNAGLVADDNKMMGVEQSMVEEILYTESQIEEDEEG